MTDNSDKNIHGRPDPAISALRGQDMVGYREVRQRLPVRAESLTQLGKGAFHANATVVAGTKVTLYYAQVGTPCSTMADLEPDYTGFVIPVSWRGTFSLNGEQVNDTSFYMPADDTLFQTSGNEHTTVNIAVRREDLIATVAALRGIGPDDVQFDSGALRASPKVLSAIRRGLTTILQHYSEAAARGALSPQAEEAMTNRALGMLTDLILHAKPPPVSTVRTAARLGKIVRKAEDYFAETQGQTFSLSDLCAAAHVSQGTLYHAFMVMCDTSPMEYFKKRRLTDARMALLGCVPQRGSVKQAAFGAGLTHLGRFSAEYCSLFGELPATTLNNRASA
jgi:AraC-like DNA-binding protein